MLTDRLPAGLRQHCVLDDVPAERLFTVRHVPDPSHTNVTGGPVARTTHWGSHLTTGNLLKPRCLTFTKLRLNTYFYTVDVYVKSLIFMG